MNAGSPKDKAPWRLTVGLALAICGMSVLLPRTPVQAQTPKVAMAGVTTQAAPAAESDGDGDGDELLEHWGDAKYRHEQQVQLLGMAVFFGSVGVLTRRRRSVLRREGRRG